MQVAGRAGRGEFDGKVIFQTYNPDMNAIQNAKSQNYLDFYNNEINRREMFNYPPFCQVIKIVFSSNDEDRVFKCAQAVWQELANQVEKHSLTEYLDISNATKCIMYKINSEYRYQIIIRNKMQKKGQYFISSFFKKCKVSDDIKMIIDIDPIDVI